MKGNPNPSISSRFKSDFIGVEKKDTIKISVLRAEIPLIHTYAIAVHELRQGYPTECFVEDENLKKEISLVKKLIIAGSFKYIYTPNIERQRYRYPFTSDPHQISRTTVPTYLRHVIMCWAIAKHEFGKGRVYSSRSADDLKPLVQEIKKTFVLFPEPIQTRW